MAPAEFRDGVAALRLLFGPECAREFAVIFPGGERLEASGRQRFVLRINAPGALRAALAPPIDLSAGRAFGAGLLEVDGDIEYAVEVFNRAGATLSPLRAIRLLRALRRLPPENLAPLREANLHGAAHTRARDRAAVGFHYDQPLEFYRSFLDRELVYSCAYFDDGVTTLDDAQMAKLDYTLRKVRLSPGERLLDVGCGWGALVVRAAQRFGAQALGITLSRKQYDEAQRRIGVAGAGERARVELRDYRELGDERFDKVVSVGMFEHVGRAKFDEYFRAAYRALRPGGLFLNHAIAHQGAGSGKITGFMARFIFPDGDLVRIDQALASAQRAGFEVRDVENLREHYARTTRAWLERLESNRDAAIAAAGEAQYRLWRLYLAGSAEGFGSGRIGVYQSLLAKSHADGGVDVPPTRRDLYE